MTSRFPRGHHGTAFVSYVDNNYLRGFETLVKSLLLHNPWIDHDFVVLYDDLNAASIARLSLLYPRFVFRKVEAEHYQTYRKGDTTNYLIVKAYYILDAFRLREYDRVVTLDTDLLILGDITHLLQTDAGFEARPQFYDSLNGWRINSGVMSFTREYMSDDFVEKIDEIGNLGNYDLERHDQGILSAALDGDYVELDQSYNLVKRAVKKGTPPPATTRVLHFTGRIKPWNGSEIGYETLDAMWHEGDVPLATLWRKMAESEVASPQIKQFYQQLADDFPGLEAVENESLEELSNRFWDEGNFEGAESAYRLLLVTRGTLLPHAWFKYGRVLRARSKREEAVAAFQLSMASTQLISLAYAELAELAWVYHDLDLAESHAMMALQHEPTQRKARQLLSRVKESRTNDRSNLSDRGPQIGHVAFYVPEEGNFGDVMLPISVRASIESEVPDANWIPFHAHQVFDEEAAHWANEHLDAVVIGGGGLFLPDTWPNGNSGWQWNVTDAALEALNIPVIVYTVGYNLFPGQQFFGDRFKISLHKLTEKASFMGLRNHGSIRGVQSWLEPELAKKVEYLPCVTTVYGKLTKRPASPVPSDKRGTIHLNIAFDRAALRFADTYDSFLSQMASFSEEMSKSCEVRFLAHAKTDERFVRDLKREHGLSIPVDAVYDMTPEESLSLIEASSVVIGMRGHAGMIPLGIGTPIISIISHKKLRFFLEDIGHSEWGVEASDDALAQKLIALTSDIVGDQQRYRAEISEAQDKLYDIVAPQNRKVKELIYNSASR